MRTLVTTLLEIAGIGCIVAGIWVMFWPLGLVALGGGLLAAGIAGER